MKADYACKRWLVRQHRMTRFDVLVLVLVLLAGSITW